MGWNPSLARIINIIGQISTDCGQFRKKMIDLEELHKLIQGVGNRRSERWIDPSLLVIIGAMIPVEDPHQARGSRYRSHPRSPRHRG